jgi:gliding motility-associated lipoprotein GldH
MQLKNWKRNKLLLTGIVLHLLLVASCTTIDVFEKQHAFQTQKWSAVDTPSFTFQIKDTASFYNIFFVMRHTDAYGFQNVWLNVDMTQPDGKQIKQQVNMQIANAKGWLGSGMDDIFDLRKQLIDQPLHLQAGKYTVKLQNIMREDPLQEVLSVGIRVEKAR